MFGRKKDEEEEEFEEEERGNRKFTKNFRDLKPENNKKRKEPPKPWGKRERIIVLTVLLATVIISAILSFSNTFKGGFGNIHLELPRFNLSSLNIFKGETIIINKK